MIYISDEGKPIIAHAESYWYIITPCKLFCRMWPQGRCDISDEGKPIITPMHNHTDISPQECPTCPYCRINLPSDWKKKAPEQGLVVHHGSYLPAWSIAAGSMHYFIVIDANFHLKQKMMSLEQKSESQSRVGILCQREIIQRIFGRSFLPYSSKSKWFTMLSILLMYPDRKAPVLLTAPSTWLSQNHYMGLQWLVLEQ